MLDAENAAENQPEESTADQTAADTPVAKKAAKKAPAKKTAAKKAAAKRTTKKTAAPAAGDVVADSGAEADQAPEAGEAPPSAKKATKKSPAKKTAAKTAKKSAAKKPAAKKSTAASEEAAVATEAAGTAETAAERPEAEQQAAAPAATSLLFQAPEPTKAAPRKKKAEPRAESAEPDQAADQATERATEAEAREDSAEKAGKADQPKKGQRQTQKRGKKQTESPGHQAEEAQESAGQDQAGDRDTDEDDTEGEQAGNRRRRRRGGRRRRKSGEDGDANGSGSNEPERESGDAQDGDSDGDSDSDSGAAGTRRRRRRRRAGENGDGGTDDPENTVVRVRKPRSAEDEITSVTGSTRLEAKKQRRREGREAGRRRAPIVSEAEFLARREAVDRVMVIRQKKDLTQIAVLEDKVLVEHYVARESQTSLIGNVYLGRVQNVLPSMEAAFIDIGKGRNAVLYAGEVNWGALGAKDGGQRKIEQVLKSGQSVLVQVTKDPIGHKGARLTSQISLPGRFLVYVPDGNTSGISRKLPDTERNRLKTLLKEIVPDTAGVIVRTAAEGASEDELTRDVERLTARWEDIQSKVQGGNAPQLLYGEPDLTLKVVRDLFTEDFGKLVVSGPDAWDMVDEYVQHLAPDLAERLEKYDGGQDVFAAYRIDEQIAKGLDRKVWLPSGGSLVIDRTEAMTVVDVNTGKFTGSGGNLEETVTKNNLEAAEEIVRQLRLRDIGGIIVVDFIDMVLESNRDLVLRRMVECLGRDRTRHQVAEVTSLGLVQMTRKRIGTGLLEAFSESCEHCGGRGVVVHHEPVEPRKRQDDEPRRGRGRGRGRKDEDSAANVPSAPVVPSPRDVAAVARPENAERPPVHEVAPEDAAATGEPAQDQPPAPIEPESQPEPETEPQAEVPSQAAPQPEPEPEPEPEPTQPSEPATPKIVTSVRRRGARRPAGAPAGATPSAEPDQRDGAPDGSAAAAPSQEAPVDATTAPATGPTTPPAEPQPPKIVTSVRKRGAVRRPAGAPTAVAPTSGAPTDGAQAPSPEPGHGPEGNGAVGLADDAIDSEPVTQPHVPIKKKGSRKR